MKKQNAIILTSGVILIILSLYIFTRPALFDIWDFSDTGQIGDTIGGITAPIINIIGAFLVYISFQAQITANRIQSKALEDEKAVSRTNNIFEKHLSVLVEIKNRLHNLEFVVIRQQPSYSPKGNTTQPIIVTYRGVDALNEFVLRLEDQKEQGRTYFGQVFNTYGQFLNYHFMLTSILDLIERIDKGIYSDDDKDYLLKNIELFYLSFLDKFGERMILVYDKMSVDELKKTKDKIDKKFKP